MASRAFDRLCFTFTVTWGNQHEYLEKHAVCARAACSDETRECDCKEEKEEMCFGAPRPMDPTPQSPGFSPWATFPSNGRVLPRVTQVPGIRSARASESVQYNISSQALYNYVRRLFYSFHLSLSYSVHFSLPLSLTLSYDFGMPSKAAFIYDFYCFPCTHFIRFLPSSHQ